MKTFVLFFALTFASFAFAQAPIKVTSKLRPDGSTVTRLVNPDEHTATETTTDARGRILSKTVFLLDEREVTIGAIHYDAKGAIRYKESYTIDSTDRPVEIALSAANGRSLGKRVLVYDSRGNAQIQDYDAAGNLLTPAKPGRPDKKKR